jgi:hypothetical protein
MRVRVGAPLQTGVALPVAPQEPRRICSPEIATLLATVVERQDFDLAALILARLAARGRRVPPALLPDLLRSARLRALPDTWIAGGRRAAWLAENRPGWAPANALQGAASSLEDGTPQERLDFLSRLMRTDPAAAVAWIEAAWPTVKAPIRQAWLALLPDPPPPLALHWLCGALTDRSPKIRVHASQLLRGLPESQLSKRCGQAAQSCLAWDRGRWTLALPAVWDSSWGEAPPGPEKGAGQRRALALISAAPLHTWTRLSGRDARACVLSLDVQDTFVAEAWRQAARREGATPWLTALLDRALGTAQGGAEFMSLVDALPSEILCLRAADVLKRRPWEQILPLIRGLSRPWPIDVARAWITRFYALCQQVERGGQEPSANALQTVRLAALALPAPLLALDTRTWVDSQASTRAQALLVQTLDDLATVLRVRRHLDQLLPVLPGAAP